MNITLKLSKEYLSDLMQSSSSLERDEEVISAFANVTSESERMSKELLEMAQVIESIANSVLKEDF